jgi:23S rRNA (adenine2503-C2)-methyltransferase
MIINTKILIIGLLLQKMFIMNKKILCGLTNEEILSMISAEGYNLNHSSAIAHSIYKKRIKEIEQLLKVPKKLKEYLSEISVTGITAPVSSLISSDKTVKYLYRNHEGKLFETVYIPDNKRNTVCVSVQSGCRMGCNFCVTGRYGFHGDLSAGDIVNQIIAIPPAEKVTHVVFMGMGEPLDNLGNVIKACKIITSEWGLAISPRNVTVSSVGISPGVDAFLEQSACNLTVSLYSPFSEERVRVIPAESVYPVHEIIKKMKQYPLRKKRRLSIAYVMIKDVNDTGRHMEALADLLKGSEIRVNLLPYHRSENDPLTSSSEEKLLYFKHNLVTSGISASVRRSRGADISAACGLLASSL